MNIDELLLDRKSLEKIRVLKLLQRNPKLSIVRISEILDVGYMGAYNRFSKLILDLSGQALEELSKEARGQVIRSASVDQYRRRLIDASLPYQVLKLIFSTNLSAAEILKQKEISLSTIQRKTTALRQYLRSIGINFHLNELMLSGDERQIRLFFWQLFWWQKEDLTALAPETDAILSELEQRSLWEDNQGPGFQNTYCRAYWQLSLLRMKNQHFVTTTNLQEMHNANTTNYATILTHHFEITPELAETELNWINYFVQRSPYLSQPSDWDIAATTFKERLINLLTQYEPVHSDLDALSNYITTGLNFAKTSHLHPVFLDRLQLRLPPAILHFPFEQRLPSNTRRLLQEMLAQLLVPLQIPAAQTSAMAVFIVVELDPVTSAALRYELDHLPVALHYVNSIQQAKIIITSQPLANIAVDRQQFIWHDNQFPLENIKQLSDQIRHYLDSDYVNLTPDQPFG
ncbi:helix-turn-helix domain-containing protein [Loigolactobacillus bifermentans]|nr:helix-turn-helix domain-containing protein [Loigolactobacillus bifermentans]QGG60629.1 hypothetical protein LB003_09220 [Loigolactobacillus bifermentans]